MDTRRTNLLKAIRFERPDYIPMSFHISRACWDYYPVDALSELMAKHPFLFPNFGSGTDPWKTEYGVNARKNEPYTDPWGCVWETSINGFVGTICHHPLSSWDPLPDYLPPSPDDTDGRISVDWEEVHQRVQKQKDAGEIVHLGLPHGHTFLLLVYIRGYENLIIDMADGVENLEKLIGLIADFNLEIVNKYLDMRPDIMGFPEDLGMQVGPMLSPGHFRRYIGPVYRKIMKPARDRGATIHMHSDGDIRLLVDDLIAGGVDVINLQNLVNGIDWIAEKFAGKICVDLDIDRQKITVNGSPAQIDALIREEVEKIGGRDGGLSMVYGLYPGVPLPNIEALMNAMEKYALFYN